MTIEMLTPEVVARIHKFNSRRCAEAQRAITVAPHDIPPQVLEATISLFEQLSGLDKARRGPSIETLMKQFVI